MPIKRTSVCILFLSTLFLVSGCGRSVPVQHFGVTLDDNGTRYRGEIDFDSYESNQPPCDLKSKKDESDSDSCEGGLLAHGTVHDLAQIERAEIDETSDGLGVYSIIVRGDDDTSSFTCTLQDRDITHAVRCEADGNTQGECSITLTPV